MEQFLLFFALSYLAVMTVFGFAMMGIDKRKSIKKAWRIPERTLFLIAFLGGGIGAFLGMYMFRHKTKHSSFVILLPVAAVIDSILILKLFKMI